ncbi:MAG TPA: radical SAM protein, partial [Gammaproteobacteria bacterium]|nr:radical SAM protein [Gammaproteobacteria bacterium]
MEQAMLTLYSKFLESQNSSLTEPVVAKITTNNKLPLPLKKDLFFLLTDESGLPDGFLGYLIPHGTNVPVAVNNIIQLTEDLSHLTSGDIVRFNPTKKSLRVLYRANSDNNSFLLTERCNSFCIMCSQPPRSVDDSYIADEIIQAIPLLPRNTREIGITGGEPTLQGEKFLEIIRQCRNYLPNTSLHVLTNGRNFEHEILAKKVSDIHHFDLMLGIPLYSDLANVHDFIVQAKGAYDQAIRGILNLKKYSQQVEIRIVILKQNYKRLPNLAEFIARNLTFVDQ